MDTLSLYEISEMCGGAAPTCGASRTTRRLSKDTRTLVPGDIYLALKGGNFDGNKYIAEAAAKGAVGAIMDDKALAEQAPEDFPVILVEDALAALHLFAANWRDRLALKVVCITGSSGKTSTKEFTSAVLGVRYRTVRTEGNLNNHIGLPLSILAASTSDDAAVWEIGMNHPGEIAPLAALARPDLAIVTNIGVAHIEYMGSREAIAEEKSALAAAVRPEGAVVVPATDDFASFIASRTKARVVYTGGKAGEVTASDVTMQAAGSSFLLHAQGESVLASLPAPGLHMVSNALLAVAAGLEFGLSLRECAEGLASTRMAGGRLSRREVKGVHFLDDTYNANPDSMEAALATMRALPCQGRRIAVLGRMGELGSYADEGYARVGRAAASAADLLIAVGPETAPLSATARHHGLSEIREAASPMEAAEVLRSLASAGDTVLVKGSRAARMEAVIQNF